MSEIGFDKRHALAEWYRRHVRPFLEEANPDSVADLDRHLDRVEALAGRVDEDIAVCFLGQCSVGKSTLINALVAGDRRLLPQGGVGPLTAQATLVRFAEQPYFEVVYQPRTRVNQLRFALEAAYERQLKAAERDVPLEVDADGEGLVDSENGNVLTEAVESSGDGKTLITTLSKQARLMVQGEQLGEIDLAYLADALRTALGLRCRWGRVVSADDVARVERLKSVIARSTEAGYRYRREEGGDRNGFGDELHEHAAGPLAPLIRELEVGWNSDVLRNGVILVDLPGLGVANDEYRTVTMKWVGEKARAVALVVDRSGIHEPEADLLRSSRFLSRLMHASDDPAADPVDLMIVAVKIDLSAADAWRLDRDRNGRSTRRWAEHFEEVQQKMTTTLRAQLAEQLRVIGTRSDENLHGEVQAVIERVIESVRLHVVAATEFSRLLADDPEDRARLETPEQSGIPQLRLDVSELRERCRAAIRHRVEEGPIWATRACGRKAPGYQEPLGGYRSAGSRSGAIASRARRGPRARPEGASIAAGSVSGIAQERNPRAARALGGAGCWGG